jgi:hypothetical protein
MRDDPAFTDAAYQQIDSGDRAEQRGHHLGRARQRPGELVGVEHVEVVVVARGQLGLNCQPGSFEEPP